MNDINQSASASYDGDENNKEAVSDESIYYNRQVIRYAKKHKISYEAAQNELFKKVHWWKN